MTRTFTLDDLDRMAARVKKRQRPSEIPRAPVSRVNALRLIEHARAADAHAMNLAALLRRAAYRRIDDGDRLAIANALASHAVWSGEYDARPSVAKRRSRA